MTTSLAQRLAAQLEQTIQYQPRRIVTRSGARVRGIFPSHHFARPMHWESPLERQLIYCLEASWIVVDAATQPVTLKIPDLFEKTGSVFDYTPDAVVLTRKDELICVECKPADIAIEKSVERRHQSITIHLNHYRTGFVVATERAFTDLVLKTNLQAMHQAWRVRCSPSELAGLRFRISAERPQSIEQLTALVGNFSAMAALARGLVFFDMRQPMTSSTPLIEFKEQIDAANFLYPQPSHTASWTELRR